MTSFQAVRVGLLTISCISGQALAETSETDWGVWAVDQNKASSELDVSTTIKEETLQQVADSKDIELATTAERESLAIESNEDDQRHEIVYGSGVIGRDENLLHELDQSSLLDYQYPIDGDFIPGGFPQDESLVTTPNDQELELEDSLGLDSEIDREHEENSELIE